MFKKKASFEELQYLAFLSSSNLEVTCFGLALTLLQSLKGKKMLKYCQNTHIVFVRLYL